MNMCFAVLGCTMYWPLYSDLQDWVLKKHYPWGASEWLIQWLVGFKSSKKGVIYSAGTLPSS